MGRDVTGLRRGWKGCEFWEQAAAQSDERDDSRGCSCDWAATWLGRDVNGAAKGSRLLLKVSVTTRVGCGVISGLRREWGLEAGAAAHVMMAGAPAT